MAAKTCIYADPKKPGGGPRLYLSSNQGWDEDPQKAVEYSSLSSASQIHQVPIGYGQSQTILAEVIKVHPAIWLVENFVSKLRELVSPASTVSYVQPEDPRSYWRIDVTSPPEKRSLVVEYRYWQGFGLKGVPERHHGEDAVLWAYKHVEPHACDCECHGPSAGFYHCFGPVCCDEADTPRTNAEKAARQGTETGSPV